MSELGNKIRVLCVDDEPQVLRGLKLQLDRKYALTTATSGAEALSIMGSSEPFAVIISDMRMPEMDGATFLAKARDLAPDATRMLLTGESGLASAIKAINEGQIFRFLSKPCSPEVLGGAIDAAIRQHELVSSEKVLLEQTLRGCLDAFTDILSLTNPIAFGRASRLKRLVSELATAIGAPDAWQVELAAMLSQLGAVTLPKEVADRYYSGARLDPEERKMVQGVPLVACQILATVPRIEVVLRLLKQFEPGPQEAAGEASLLVQVLRLANAYDVEITAGKAPAEALAALGASGRHAAELLDVFAGLRGVEVGASVVEMAISQVRVGMIFAADVMLTRGALMVSKGYEATPSFLNRIANFPRGSIVEPVRVIVPRLGGARAAVG